MDLEKIEGLVKIIENSSLTEFTLKEGDLKITMSKLDNPPVVGLANGVMLAEHHRVDMVDINKKKVDMINCHKNPIADEMIL